MMSGKLLLGTLAMIFIAAVIGYFARWLWERMDDDPGPTNWVAGFLLVLCALVGIFLITPALSFLAAGDSFRWRFFPFSYLQEILLNIIYIIVFVISFRFSFRKREVGDEEMQEV